MAEARYIPVVIAINTATSEAVTLKPGERVVGLETPSAWTAADVVLQVSRDGTTFVDVMDLTGALIRASTIAAAAAEVRLLDYFDGLSVPIGPVAVRLRSCNTGSSADVNQAAARTLYIIASTG